MNLISMIFRNVVKIDQSPSGNCTLCLTTANPIFTEFTANLPHEECDKWGKESQKFCDDYVDKKRAALERQLAVKEDKLNTAGVLHDLKEFERKLHEYMESQYSGDESLEWPDEVYIPDELIALVVERNELKRALSDNEVSHFTRYENMLFRIAFCKFWWQFLTPRARDIYHGLSMQMLFEMLMRDLKLPVFREYLLKNLSQIIQTNLELLFIKIPIPIPIHLRPQIQPNSPNVAA